MCIYNVVFFNKFKNFISQYILHSIEACHDTGPAEVPYFVTQMWQMICCLRLANAERVAKLCRQLMTMERAIKC